MLRNWVVQLWNLRGTVLAGLARFPVSLGALLPFVVLVNIAIAGDTDLANDTITRAGAASVAAAMIAAAAILLGERRGLTPHLRHGVSIVVAAVAAGAIWFWEPLGVAPAALLLATILAVPLAPYLRRSPEGFWQFVWRLSHAVALAFIAVIVFCLGFSAILASLEYLFGVDIEARIYGHVWSIGLGFVGPLFALSLVPVEFPEQDTPDGADIIVTGVRVLSDFVAVPLLATYAVILHAYAAKIVLSGEVPKNQIGWMVLSFGLSVLVLRILAHPLGELARMPTRLFLRFWPLLLVVPLALLVNAVRLRMADYGVTPERYGLAMFALFLGVVLFAQIPKRLRGDIRLIPAVGAGCLLLASIGPWGMLPVSAASQMSRLTGLLAADGLLQDGRLASPPSFDYATAQDVQSIVVLLNNIGQIERIRPLFEGHAANPFEAAHAATGKRPDLSLLVQKALDADRAPIPLDRSGAFWLDASASAAVPIDGFDLVVPGLVFDRRSASTVAIPDLGMQLSLTAEGIALSGSSGRVLLAQADLRHAAEERLERMTLSPEGRLPPVFLTEEMGGRRVGVLIQSLSGQITGKDFRLDGGRVDLFLRRADWR